MQLNLFFHALTLLCSLASVVFAAVDARRRSWFAVACGFGAGLFLGLNRMPDASSVGATTAVVAFAALMRPAAWPIVAASGGALGGLWATLLGLAGISLPVSAALAALALAAAKFFARQPDFAPQALREEALLVVTLLGLAVAIAPGVAAGWQSAAVLNLQPEQVASQAVPAWTLLLTGGAAALGGLYTVWVRR